MHEMSYCEGVVEAVERRAAGRPVARVGVRIGAVHRVVADAFEQSFQIAAVGGPAEGAATQLVVVPVHGHCMDCRNDFASTDPFGSITTIPGSEADLIVMLSRRSRILTICVVPSISTGNSTSKAGEDSLMVCVCSNASRTSLLRSFHS